MLAMRAYAQDYIDNCRARIGAQLAATQTAGPERVAALAAFEPISSNNLTLALDSSFAYRGRTMKARMAIRSTR